MADTDKTVAYGVTADASGFEKGMQDAARSASNAAAAIDDNFKKVKDAFANVQKQLFVLAAMIKGGELFKDAISATNQLTSETMQLSRSLGITGEEASTLNTALNTIGSSSDEYVGAFTKFAKQIKTNEAEMKAFGLQTRDSSGHLRDSNTLFVEALGSIGKYKAGLDQNIYAQMMFGKSVDEAMRLQKLNNQLLEESKAKNEALGLTLSKENVAASKAYRLALVDVNQVLLGVKKAVGEAVMPVFTELGHWFAEVGPTVVTVFKTAVSSVSTVIQTAMLAVKVLARSIGALADPVFTFGRALQHLLKGDMNRATQEMMNIGKHWGESFGEAWEHIKTDSESTFESVKNLWGNGTPVGEPKSGDKSMPNMHSRMSQWEAQLADAKLAVQERNIIEGTGFRYSKQQELTFWKEKLAITRAGTEENMAVRKRVADLAVSIGEDQFAKEIAHLDTQAAAYKHNTAAKLAILEQEAIKTKEHWKEESKEYEAVQKRIVEVKRAAVEQQKQIDLLRSQAVRDQQQGELQLREQQAQLERELRIINQAELLAQQQVFEGKRFDIQMSGLRERERLALADPDRNLVEIETIHRQIEAAEREHQTRLNQIRGEASKEANRHMTGAYGSMQSGFASVIAKTLQGSQTLKATFQGLFQSVVQAVTQALAQIAAEWLVKALFARLLGRTTAMGEITANAGVAGSAAVASTAAIPIIGPALAPAAGAAAMAAAMSYMPMASAAGGYDIPGTINPIVQTHAREMILPAKYADVIRGMAGDGVGGGGDAIHLHVNATDAQSVARLFSNNADALIRVLRQRKRDFAY
jgi:hypothetical protein